MENEETKEQAEQGQDAPIIEQSQFDWRSLGVEEFKGEETVNHLKSLIDKGKSYDDIAPYKDRYDTLNSFYDTVSDPTKYFADGEAGMRREQLRMKYPNISVDVAAMISNNGEDLKPIDAMAVAMYLKSGCRSSLQSIKEVLAEENGLEDYDDLDEKGKEKANIRLEMKAYDAKEYIKSINADVKIPDIQNFNDYAEKRKAELEGLNTQLSETWTKVAPEVKNVIKSTAIKYEGEYELDGVKHKYEVPVALSDEDLALVDVISADMAKSKTAPTKEVMSAIHEMVANASLKQKLPQIISDSVKQIAESIKNQYTNPQLPRAEDKPKGAEQVGANDADLEVVKEWLKKQGQK